MVLRGWRRKAVKCPAAVLIVGVVVFFFGMIVIVDGAQETEPPVFGKGATKVRLYTDYFCKPCRAAAPKLEPILMDLVRRDVVSLTFIDTPFYPYSSIYAGYFLFALVGKSDIERAFEVRRSLTAAAAENISNAAKLEERLKGQGIALKPIDVKPLFAIYRSLLTDDGVEETPSCAIESDGKREIFKGSRDIGRALKKLSK